MTQVRIPPTAYRPLAYGAIGGFLAAILSLAVMIAATVYLEGTPQLALNVVGASVVWWLQTAVHSALDGVYWDATLGGAVLFVLLGTVLGAVFSGLLDRLPTDQPILWGLALGFVLWVVSRWALAPSLNSVAARALPTGVLLVTDLAFGALMGAWVHAGRQVGPEI